MSLEHEFFLVPNTVAYPELMKCNEQNIDIIDSIDIPDDLIQYIADSLNWIPCKNPAISMTKENIGINYYGVTLFDQTSAATMKSIFTAWLSLFTNSLEKLELTGEFVHSSNKKVLGGRERLVFCRNDVLELLKRLLSMIERLEEENLYLYHLGI
ncbi:MULTISPECIES: hypothetical protein [Planococcus]|uniref:Uncharacterized protein n=1 Tax=Planococcus faecalis TaxID=1598147 RepID=A0ABN4XGK7_9BACL|nr:MULTISPECIES: hypothetical protein [Planococcus]AQU78888.1 hypothetical protein AJGP001_06295 [Planococcus faecalis]MDJ0333042.1 hypothetical protein [Planococcus sp. S3-L1]OHX51369.1 hypothetical protein BB777_17155 [Planococcus faecalis]